MKVIFDYFHQPRTYADSRGLCLIELEEGETLQDVREKYIIPQKEWYQEKYSNLQEVNEYTATDYKDEIIVYKGRLALMNTFRMFLD